MPITKIHARQVYDSRGNPTVEVDVVTETGVLNARPCDDSGSPADLLSSFTEPSYPQVPARVG